MTERWNTMEDEKPANLHELFHQTEWWMSGKGWIRVDDMDLDHLQNLKRYLTTRANRYGSMIAYYLRSQTLSMATGMQPSGDAACDAFDSAMDQAWEEAFQAERKTDVWFSGLPLVLRIKGRINELENPEPPIIGVSYYLMHTGLPQDKVPENGGTFEVVVDSVELQDYLPAGMMAQVILRRVQPEYANTPQDVPCRYIDSQNRTCRAKAGDPCVSSISGRPLTFFHNIRIYDQRARNAQ